MSLSTAAGMNHYHIQSLYLPRVLESILPLPFNLPSFTQESQSADLQLQNRPHCFWKYFSTHDGALVLKDYNSFFSTTVLQFLQSKWIGLHFLFFLLIPWIRVPELIECIGWNLFLWKTMALWFCACSVHITLRFGHIKELQELHWNFHNTNVYYFGCVFLCLM